MCDKLARRWWSLRCISTTSYGSSLTTPRLTMTLLQGLFSTHEVALLIQRTRGSQRRIGTCAKQITMPTHPVNRLRHKPLQTGWRSPSDALSSPTGYIKEALSDDKMKPRTCHSSIFLTKATAGWRMWLAQVFWELACVHRHVWPLKRYFGQHIISGVRSCNKHGVNLTKMSWFGRRGMQRQNHSNRLSTMRSPRRSTVRGNYVRQVQGYERSFHPTTIPYTNITTHRRPISLICMVVSI